jgi:hypothetical protein
MWRETGVTSTSENPASAITCWMRAGSRSECMPLGGGGDLAPERRECRRCTGVGAVRAPGCGLMKASRPPRPARASGWRGSPVPTPTFTLRSGAVPGADPGSGVAADLMGALGVRHPRSQLVTGSAARSRREVTCRRCRYCTGVFGSSGRPTSRWSRCPGESSARGTSSASLFPNQSLKLNVSHRGSVSAARWTIVPLLSFADSARSVFTSG